MPRFQSILSRIVILHIIAVVITSILMSVGLSWLLSYATNNIHNKAMQEQADAVAEHLSIGPDGRLQLNLPSDLLGLYSPEYARYSYAVTNEHGAVLFSSYRPRASSAWITPTSSRTRALPPTSPCTWPSCLLVTLSWACRFRWAATSPTAGRFR